jgi:hypothetical protein
MSGSILPTMDQNNFIHLTTLEDELVEGILEDFLSKKQSWTKAPSTRGYMLMSSIYMSSSLKLKYLHAIHKCAKEYTHLYPHCVEGHSNWQANPVFNLQYYPPGNHYSVWHCENNGDTRYSKRILAFMTYLNTVFKGGETEFLYQDIKFSPTKGNTLICPAYFTHTHRGIPAPTEDKFIITGWFEYVDQEKHHQDAMAMNDNDFYQEIHRFNEKTF